MLMKSNRCTIHLILRQVSEGDTPVPPASIEGREWWLSHRPNTSSDQLDELMTERFVFVEEQVLVLLAPIGDPSRSHCFLSV